MKEVHRDIPPSRKILKKMIFPLFSLILIFFLIYRLLKHIEQLQIQSGSTNSNLYLWIIVESFGLLIIPLICKTTRSKSSSNQKTSYKIKDPDAFKLKIRKQFQFDVKYSPNIIVKCPQCKFENPSYVKICFNCGNKFDF